MSDEDEVVRVDEVEVGVSVVGSAHQVVDAV